MFGFFSNKPRPHVESVKRALEPKAVVIVSASCCAQGMQKIDDQTVEAAQAALAEAKLDWPVLTVTITEAQSALGRVMSDLDEAGAAAAKQVSDIFLSHGLAAFPVVIVDQKLISYGGAPSVDLIRKALPIVCSA